MSVEKKKQIKNSIIYLFPVLIGQAIPLLTLPFFTRILTPKDYGILALAQIYSSFANSLVNCGMQTAYQRNYFQYEDSPLKTSQLLYSVLLFVSLNFILFGGLTIIFQDKITALLGLENGQKILFWNFCANFFTTTGVFYLTFFRNSEDAKSYAYYVIAGAIIDALLSVLFVAYLRTGPIGLVLAQLLSAGFICFFLTVKLLLRFPFSFNLQIFREAFQIAYPLTPRIFFGVLNSQFDKYMIRLLSSLGGVGIYDIGQKIANMVFIYMTAIQNVYSPQVYKQMFRAEKDGPAKIGRYLTPFAYISILPGVLIVLFSEECIKILVPSSFYGAIPIVIIMTLFFGSLFFGKINGDQLIFAKKTHITSLFTLLNLGFNVGLNLLFIKRWGAIGAAWATLLASILSSFVLFPIAQRASPIVWENKKILAIFSTFFACGFLILFVHQYGVPYFARLGIKLSAMTFYLLIGVKLGIFSKENFQLTKGIIVEKLNFLRPLKLKSI